MARTETHAGCRFDLGGHRFFTRMPGVQELWESVLPEGLLRVGRRSRIHFRDRFIRYPIELSDVLRQVGPREGAEILLSYARARIRPRREEETFAGWVSSRFGPRLYEMFFRDYTEKVWGLDGRRLGAELAADRIQAFSLGSALWGALTGRGTHDTQVDRFLYPEKGAGTMWDAFRRRVEAMGGVVRTEAEVVGLAQEGGRVRSLTVRSGGDLEEIPAAGVITTAPLRDLVRLIRPEPPAEVVQAAGRIPYRDFLLVGLVLGCEDPFPDQWIYVHDPRVAAGRIQNFGNWSPAMVPDGRSALGVEYFCSQGDALWSMTDEALVDLACRDLERLGLAGGGEAEAGAVFRQTEAYPVYLRRTPRDVQAILGFLSGISNLRTVGRNGLHRYDNQDRAMLTGLRAAEDLLGNVAGTECPEGP
jgi:protoporphyrinogen oxidase